MRPVSGLGSYHRLVLIGGFWLLALSGCSTSRTPSPAPPAAVPVPVSLTRRSPALVSAPVSQVQSSPLYHQAEQAYRRHQFAQALLLLDQMRASPGQSPDALTYLERQRSFCLQALGQKPVSAPPAVAASSPTASPAEADCGPRALYLVCQRLGVSASVARLRQLAGTTSQGTSMAGLAQAAQAVGLKAEGVQVSREALGQVEMPALGWVNRRHYVALFSLQGEGEQATATIHDPNQPHEETISKERLLELTGGTLLLVHR